MPAYVEALASTDIFTGRCGMPEREVYLKGSGKYFKSSLECPTDPVLPKLKTLTKDVLISSQGGSDDGSKSDAKMGGTDALKRAVTEKESSNFCVANVEGSWGSLETYPCSRNVFTGESSKSRIYKVAPLSIEKKRLTPSFTTGGDDNHDCTRIDPDGLAPEPLTATAPEKNSSGNSSKLDRNRLSWGEEVMMGILGKAPNDFTQLSSSASATHSSMSLDRTNSKSSLASSDQSLQSKIKDSDYEMNPVACWKDSVWKTFHRDRNLGNRVCTRKSYAVSKESFPPKEIFSAKLLNSYDPAVRATWAENDKVNGESATDPSGVPKSKHTTLSQMPEQAFTDSGFFHSYVKSWPKEKIVSAIEQESEDKSLDTSSARSSIKKLPTSQLWKEERSSGGNPSLDTSSMVSTITSSSTTSISKSVDESDKYKKYDVYPFSPSCLYTAGKVICKEEKVRQVSPRLIEPQRYLPGNCFPGQTCLRQGGHILYPQGGPILCPHPVNGGFITPQLSTPLICIPEHWMGQSAQYIMPHAPHIVISPPSVSPFFFGGPAGIHNSTVYHQTPVQFQIPGGYQPQTQRPYFVDQVDRPVRVNLPLTTENVNMHNRACVANDNNLS